jgi:hypothetical protein
MNKATETIKGIQVVLSVSRVTTADFTAEMLYDMFNSKLMPQHCVDRYMLNELQYSTSQISQLTQVIHHSFNTFTDYPVLKHWYSNKSFSHHRLNHLIAS